MKRTISEALILISILILLVGCKKTANENTPLPDAAGQIGWYAEAYLPAQPVPKKEKAKKTYPDKADVDKRNANYVPANNNKADNGKINLTLVEFAGTVLYRMADTYYYMQKPIENNNNTQISINNWAAFYNELAQKNPTVNFYAYYINRAADNDWFEGFEYYNYYEYLVKSLGEESRIKTGQYIMNSIEDYYETGYKTDFHVNYIGSHRVYNDIYNMLAGDMDIGPALVPEKMLDFNLSMVGDLFDEVAYNSIEWDAEQMDVFKAYKYNIPEYKSYLNDKEMQLGMEEEFIAGEIPDNPRFGHQFLYYGGQTGVVRFEFDNKEKLNLLMLSDSQGRPSRLPIASHFNTTVFLDDVQTRGENLNEVIEKYNIDVVIYVGQGSMFEFYDE